MGSIKDAHDTPLAFANVFLLNVNDSTQIDGTSCDDKGYFEIANVSSGDYLIKASYIEDESDLLPITVRKDINIGPIAIIRKVKKLEEVTLTQQKPRIERKVDRLVFSIENTTFADSDIWQVLKHTPNVAIINNELTVKGNRSVGILINDRKVNLPQEDVINLLSGTSASNVETIEVITNPPAKYSAEGGMLINIKMKKNLISGYNGALHNRYVQGVFAKHSLGTDHFFKSSKTGFSLSYNFSKDKNITRYTDITNFLGEMGERLTWTAEQDYSLQRGRHNLNAFFDYDINDKNRLSFSTINILTPKADRFYDTNTLIRDANNGLSSSFKTTNVSKVRRLNTSYYLDYVHELTKDGAEVSMNAHYTFYDYGRDQALQTDFSDAGGNLTGENDFTTDSKQQINLWSFRTDYFTSLGKSLKFETGLRYAGTASTSLIEQEGFNPDQPGIDPTETGNFTYDENIYAAYTSFKGKTGSFNYKLGLRAEYTETQSLLDNGSGAIDNDYFNLFPSFSVQYEPSKKHNYNLYYYRRITRPRFNKVNPFQIFQSNFSVIEGDPGLLPATRHYVSGGYTYDKNYTVELFYRNEKNPFRELVFQDNETNLMRFITTNLERRISYGIDLTINKKLTSFWNAYVFVSLYDGKFRFSDNTSTQSLENGQWSWFVFNTHSFTLLNDKSLSANIDFRYFSAFASGNAVQDSYNELAISFRKTLWNKRASISLGVEDIFNQSNLFTSRQFLDQSSSSLYRPENRLFTLGFRYKFGNVKIKDNKKSKRVDERNRI